MSIATSSLGAVRLEAIRKAESDARAIAKEHGVKLRKNPRGGIDVTFDDGEKEHFYGWLMLREEFVKIFNLAGIGASAIEPNE